MRGHFGRVLGGMLRLAPRGVVALSLINTDPALAAPKRALEEAGPSRLLPGQCQPTERAFVQPRRPSPAATTVSTVATVMTEEAMEYFQVSQDERQVMRQNAAFAAPYLEVKRLTLPEGFAALAHAQLSRASDPAVLSQLGIKANVSGSTNAIREPAHPELVSKIGTSRGATFPRVYAKTTIETASRRHASVAESAAGCGRWPALPPAVVGVSGFAIDTSSPPTLVATLQHSDHIDTRFSGPSTFGTLLQVREISSYRVRLGSLVLQVIRPPGDVLAFAGSLADGSCTLVFEGGQVVVREARDGDAPAEHGACTVGPLLPGRSLLGVRKLAKGEHYLDVFSAPTHLGSILMTQNVALNTEEAIEQAQSMICSFTWPQATVVANEQDSYDEDYFKLDTALIRFCDIDDRELAGAVCNRHFNHERGYGMPQSTRAQVGDDHVPMLCPTCLKLVDVKPGHRLTQYKHGIADRDQADGIKEGQPLARCSAWLADHPLPAGSADLVAAATTAALASGALTAGVAARYQVPPADAVATTVEAPPLLKGQEKQLLPGWTAMLRTTANGRSYKILLGPNGERAPSYAEMNRKFGPQEEKAAPLTAFFSAQDPLA